MSGYTCSYRQLFNVFGAPGIPNTYQATLTANGSVIERREFCFRVRAERQCLRWAQMYGARIVHTGHPGVRP